MGLGSGIFAFIVNWRKSQTRGCKMQQKLLSTLVELLGMHAQVLSGAQSCIDAQGPTPETGSEHHSYPSHDGHWAPTLCTCCGKRRPYLTHSSVNWKPQPAPNHEPRPSLPSLHLRKVACALLQPGGAATGCLACMSSETSRRKTLHRTTATSLLHLSHHSVSRLHVPRSN